MACTELAFVIWALGWAGPDWTWDLDEHLFSSGMASTLGSWVGHVFRHLGQDYTYPLPYILVNNVLLMVPVQTGPWRAFHRVMPPPTFSWLHSMRPVLEFNMITLKLEDAEGPDVSSTDMELTP